jgi:hypothetical protein
MRKLTYSEREVHISTGGSVPLVEIKDLKQTVGEDEPALGMVRVYMHFWPNGLTLQMRAKTRITDRAAPKNLIASTHLSIEDLEAIVAFFRAGGEVAAPDENTVSLTP